MGNSREGPAPGGAAAKAAAGSVPRGLVITIDGPAGAGKTTVSRCLACRIGYRYIDTGALYRAVAWVAGQRGIAPDDEKGLSDVCRHLELEIREDVRGMRVFANGADVTDRLRTPEITMFASAASARATVRQYLLSLQRSIGEEKNAVFEGRDMGTVVFPEADAKFFLDADIETRALRRFREYEGKDNNAMEGVKKEMRLRDRNDSTRALAPLTPAPDALTIDSTGLTVDQVVDRMIAHIRAKESRKIPAADGGGTN